MINVAPNTIVPPPEHVTNAKEFMRREFGPAHLSMTCVQPEATVMTCKEKLHMAETAYERLITGQSVQVVSHDGRTVTYIPSQAGRLEAYIRQLQRKCGDASQMAGGGCGRAKRVVCGW